MNAKISVFVICVAAIIYLLQYNLHDCTFKSNLTSIKIICLTTTLIIGRVGGLSGFVATASPTVSILGVTNHRKWYLKHKSKMSIYIPDSWNLIDYDNHIHIWLYCDSNILIPAV